MEKNWVNILANPVFLCLNVYTLSLAMPQGSVQRRQWHPTPVLLPGKSHGQRSLVGCSPWGREESDMTERLHFHFSLLCIGEGDGNPLQCSCLENPRDGVAQSRTQLKWLSSSKGQLLLSLLHEGHSKVSLFVRFFFFFVMKVLSREEYS